MLFGTQSESKTQRMERKELGRRRQQSVDARVKWRRWIFRVIHCAAYENPSSRHDQISLSSRIDHRSLGSRKGDSNKRLSKMRSLSIAICLRRHNALVATSSCGDDACPLRVSNGLSRAHRHNSPTWKSRISSRKCFDLTVCKENLGHCRAIDAYVTSTIDRALGSLCSRNCATIYNTLNGRRVQFSQHELGSVEVTAYNQFVSSSNPLIS